MRRFTYLIPLLIMFAAGPSCNRFDTNVMKKRLCLIASMETIIPPPPSGAFSLSRFGITWYFDRPLGVNEYGQFANGDYWVVGPVSIIYISPLSYRSRTGRVWNGSMVNPSPRSGMMQGYDSAMYGQYGPGYDPDLNAGFPHQQFLSEWNPLVLLPGSSLVSTQSAPVPGARSQLDSAAVLTVLASAPEEGDFRPPYSGTDKSILYNKTDLNYFLLSTLAPVAGTPSLATVERYFERPWIDHVPGWTGGFIHPVNNMPNYGREIASEISEGALMLHLNFSSAEKETLLVRYVQLGIDLYGIVMDGGEENWPPNGGHASGRKWPIMFAGLVLGDANMAGIGARSDVYFGEDGQTFYITADDVALDHHPDERSCELEYSPADVGLPEWGIVHATNRVADNKNWETVYRQCCTTHAWGGFILSALIMNQKAGWNHNVIFDYTDRYMAIELERNGTGAWTRSWSHFVENMWDTYRSGYGPVWPAGTAWEGTELNEGLSCD
jgi:hypothetical protein